MQNPFSNTSAPPPVTDNNENPPKSQGRFMNAPSVSIHGDEMRIDLPDEGQGKTQDCKVPESTWA